jgi:hypothetical protein
MAKQPLGMTLLPEPLAVCRLPAEAPVPAWVMAGSFFSLTRTPQELSIVLPEARLPAESSGIKAERGFRAFRIDGPLDFALTGVLSELLAPLARAAIPVFVLSTYDTDLILVRGAQTEGAAEAWGELVTLRREGA